MSYMELNIHLHLVKYLSNLSILYFIHMQLIGISKSKTQHESREICVRGFLMEGDQTYVLRSLSIILKFG